MNIKTLATELEAIEVSDAEYRRQLLDYLHSTHSYLLRQIRRVEIIELMQEEW